MLSINTKPNTIPLMAGSKLNKDSEVLNVFANGNVIPLKNNNGKIAIYIAGMQMPINFGQS